MKPHINPKGLALYLMAAVDLGNETPLYKETADILLKELAKRQIASGGGRGWGYPFDWQSRAFFAPAGTPNVVVTSFAGQAALDALDAYGDPRSLDLAKDACRFIASSLHQHETPDGVCFSYTPIDRSRIDNANLLAAALLVRTGTRSGDASWVELGLRAARYTVRRQQKDGSWTYGEARNQSWIDHFHTGFNLVALQSIRTATKDFDDAIHRGLRFYVDHFFQADGAPRYWATSAYPYDAHSAAQGLVTLSAFRDQPGIEPLRGRLLDWTLNHLIDKKTGAVTYQIHRFYRNTIPYQRWATAWMTHAMARVARS